MNDYEWRLKPDRYSNWTRLVRVQSWVVRFIENCRLNKEKISGELREFELEETMIKLIKNAQKDTFPVEVDCLTRGKKLLNSRKILALNPKTDDNGLLRCDSRLKYAT